MMELFSNPADVLKDPQVKSYLLGILDSDLTSEEKYQKFVDFFETESLIKSKVLSRAGEIRNGDDEEIDRILSQVGQDVGLWKPQEVLQQIEDGIKRALRRLARSQHPDAGWGFNWQRSDIWGTAYAVLCLLAARTVQEFVTTVDIERMLEDGLSWLQEHPWEWSVDCISPMGGMSVYHVSVALRCFYQAGKQYLGAVDPVVSRSVEKLIQTQNADGGWDASLWGSEIPTQTRVWSEVGATSLTLQALAATRGENVKVSVDKGVQWLIHTQNPDGSWNDGNCRPDADPCTLSGSPAVEKTCDALQGILVSCDLGIPIEEREERIEKAVEWIQAQERAFLGPENQIGGWGWDDSTQWLGFATGLTLETLVRIPGVSLSLLSNNAQWLIHQQCQEPGDEDGNWPQGHTGRYALCLIEYYKVIKDSAMFTVR